MTPNSLSNPATSAAEVDRIAANAGIEANAGGCVGEPGTGIWGASTDALDGNLP